MNVTSATLAALINFDFKCQDSERWIVSLEEVHSTRYLKCWHDRLEFLWRILFLSFLTSEMCVCVVIAMNKVQSDQRAVEWNDHFEWMRNDECDLCLFREMCESRPLNFFQQPKLVSFRINQAILFGIMTWTGQRNDISTQFTTGRWKWEWIGWKSDFEEVQTLSS